MMKIGILGLGKMGEALTVGLRGKYSLLASARTKEKSQELSKRLSIICGTDNVKVVEAADILLLCVKPHQMQGLLEEIRPRLKPKKLLISIAASITLNQMKTWSGGKSPIIRAMPNLPATVGEGMTVLSSQLSKTSEEMKLAEAIFESIGKVTILEEALMDAVTGLSACGPAFAFLVIESLCEAGVKVGIPRKISTLLATQMILGSATMVLKTGRHPAELKDEVTTPAGCTTDGLMALEEGGIRATLIKAVVAATEKSKTLRPSS